MLPMALHQYEQGLTALPPSPKALCPRFESHGNGRGRCLSYEHRPTVCRLFGFAGIRNKHGLVQLTQCRVQKQLGQHPNPNATPPLFETAARCLTGIHAGYGTERLPIYEALRQALEKVALAAAYSSAAHACATATAAPVPPGPSRYSAFHSGDFCS